VLPSNLSIRLSYLPISTAPIQVRISIISLDSASMECRTEWPTLVHRYQHTSTKTFKNSTSANEQDKRLIHAYGDSLGQILKITFPVCKNHSSRSRSNVGFDIEQRNIQYQCSLPSHFYNKEFVCLSLIEAIARNCQMGSLQVFERKPCSAFQKWLSNLRANLLYKDQNDQYSPLQRM